MRTRLVGFLDLLQGNAEAGRVVPHAGATAWLTILGTAATTFLAVLAVLAAAMGGRAAAEWSGALALSVTIRQDATVMPKDQARVALDRVVTTVPGVVSVREVPAQEQRALLAPLVGDGLADLPLPLLYAIEMAPEAENEIDNLRLRLAAEVPEAVLEDPNAWRRPVIEAAASVLAVSRLALVAVLAVLATTVVLAAEAAIAANRGNIRTLRLIGATDRFIVRAFVRRITLGALAGAVVGLALGAGATLMAGGIAGDLMPAPGLQGWVFALLLLPLVGVVAFVATRVAAFRALRRIS